MIKHIVMFKLTEKTEQNLGELKDRLLGLKEKIDVLQSLEVGINYIPSNRAMDIVLTTTFTDGEALETYRLHPDHQNVVTRIKELCSETKVVDFKY